MKKNYMKEKQDDINTRVNRGISGQPLQDTQMAYDPATGQPLPCAEVNLDPKYDMGKGFDNEYNM